MSEESQIDLAAVPESARAEHAAFAAAAETAETWTSAAIRALQSGVWQPTEAERWISVELLDATRDDLPTYAAQVLPVRVQRIARWGGALQLAARAADTTLATVSGPPPARPKMADLLAGIYTLAAQGEMWLRELNRAADTSGGDSERVFLADHPTVPMDLAAAEILLLGIASIPTVFAAIADYQY